MTETLDPSAPIQKPEPPKPENSTSLVDNDNLVLVSLADLKRFLKEMDDNPDRRNDIRSVLLYLIESIEADKAAQLEAAQAAMEKFNPVTPVGDV